VQVSPPALDKGLKEDKIDVREIKIWQKRNPVNLVNKRKGKLSERNI
jgi:hypothetical protein